MNNNQVVDNSAVIIKRNRFFGIIIILMVVAPMAIAYIMFQTGWGVSSSTTNKGELLTPAVAIQDLRLSDNTDFFNHLFSDKKAKKKWRLLVPVSEVCHQDCQKNLYTTRQVHIRLAEKAYRVERILLSLDVLSETFKEQLLLEHPNTLQAETRKDEFLHWMSVVKNNDNAENNYYLVDQKGFVMMRYNASNTGQDLLDDIKKLLKFTYDK